MAQVVKRIDLKGGAVVNVVSDEILDYAAWLDVVSLPQQGVVIGLGTTPEAAVADAVLTLSEYADALKGTPA